MPKIHEITDTSHGDKEKLIEIDTANIASPPEVGKTPISSLAKVLLSVIASMLPLSAVAQMARVSKKFQQAINNPIVWKQQIRNYDMPLALTFGNPEQPLKEKFSRYFLAVSEIKKTYPPAIINTFTDAKTIAALQKLDIGEKTGSTGYLDFITHKNVQGHKVMRGTDAWGRPFISLCGTSDNGGAMVLTLFQRHAGNKDFWVPAGSHFIPQRNGELSANSLEYLGRLFRGEPCGEFGGDFLDEELEPKINAKGQSMVRLTDQSEEPVEEKSDDTKMAGPAR